MFEVTSYLALNNSQTSAVVPFVLVPRPTGFFALKTSKALAHTLQVIHSSAVGFVKFYGISVCGIAARNTVDIAIVLAAVGWAVVVVVCHSCAIDQ